MYGSTRQPRSRHAKDDEASETIRSRRLRASAPTAQPALAVRLRPVQCCPDYAAQSSPRPVSAVSMGSFLISRLVVWHGLISFGVRWW